MPELKKLYEGKAKIVYQEANSPHYLMEFKDSLTAFDAQKKGSFANKGSVNRDIASLIFRALNKHGIESHWVEDLGTNQMRVKPVTIIPLEVVVRNILAGSLAKRLGREEGERLKRPVVEFFYKDDALHDPFINDDHVLMMGIAGEKEIAELKTKALALNSVLVDLWKSLGVLLVDFKIEFGKTADGRILLADEISPDTCRLWDAKTLEKMDKDRFRRDLGGIEEAYKQLLKRLSEGQEVL